MHSPDEPRIRSIGTDPAAFSQFYRAHADEVTRFVARRVADPHLAADLTAEVFLAAVEAAGSYRPGRGEPAAWLTGIARNVVSAEHRRAGRERRAHASAGGRRLLDDDDIARMQARIDAAARSRELYGALAHLPEGERAVLELTALEGMSPGEAARVLGIRAVTARVRLHRARLTLRGTLADGDSPTVIRPMEA